MCAIKTGRHSEQNDRTTLVRDLSFLYSENGFGWLERHILHFTTRYRIRHSALVVVPSARVSDEVRKYYRATNIKIDGEAFEEKTE